MKQFFLLCALLLTGAKSFACTASFTLSAAPSNNNLLQIKLINSSSYGTVPTGYREYTRIDFGDGTILPDGGGSWRYHIYSSPGVYTVKLVAMVNDTLTGSSYCKDSTTGTITVAYPSCGTIVSHLNDTGGLVTFSAANPAGTAGLKYTWYFGDGTHDTGSTVTHTYLGNGVYTVTLADTSVSGSCNYNNSFSDTISSGTYYCDSIHASVGYFNMGTSIYMINSSYKNPYPTLTPHELYIYGDGTSGSMTNHTYPGYGNYLLKLVTDWVDTFSHIIVCRDTTIADTVRLTPPPPYIEGSIYFDSTGPFLSSYDCKVWLISFDTLTNIVTAIDSVTTRSSYAFRNTYAIGTYLVKVKAIYDTTGYGYVPTYYASGMYWNTASKINYTKTPYNNADVTMKHGTATSGPGFIAGNVLYGAGKTTGGGPVGAPVAGLHVMLLNSSGKLIKQTYTDTSGTYSFSDLPLGTYSIFPESLGYITTPASSINLMGSNPADTGVSFKQNSTSIFPAYLGIDKLAPNATLTVYPNPNNGSFIIIGNNSFTDAVTMTITNMTGQDVYTKSMTNMEHNHTIDLSFLPAGTYFISLRTCKANQMIKMDIVH